MIQKSTFKNSVWKTPYLPPIPYQIEGAQDTAVLLTDRDRADWSFLFEKIGEIPSPYDKDQDFDFNTVEQGKWQPVVVPGSLTMQGFPIQNNTEYYYKRRIAIPDNFHNKRMYLRFEGVYSNARVWVNNRLLKTHIGGFTVWDCDITSFAGEQEITVVIGVTDVEGSDKGIWNADGRKISNSAWGSYYAHHNIGGILRDITLFSLPETYIARSHINTCVDRSSSSGTISAAFEVHALEGNIEVAVQLCDADKTIASDGPYIVDASYSVQGSFDNSKLVMAPDHRWQVQNKLSYENDRKYSTQFINQFEDMPNGHSCYAASLTLNAPAIRLWDAEHPNLYTLRLSLICNGEVVEEISHQLGFREITYGGKNGTDKNKVYINGNEIKLRGVCRHDVSHLYGRSLTREDIDHEIRSYKRNNINHVRTSHYPVSGYFLEVCDKLGIYVEQENAACFKGANNFGIYNAPQDFVNTFAEMIENDRNHPSVIIWSLANESGFEKTFAFRTEYRYVKEVDVTRPVIFSYPHTVHSKPLPYDILSHHYKKVTSALGHKEFPMLHDEFAHVACYNTENLRLDNSCRAFWGESIKKGWDSIFTTDGALGCAIWGGVDDVFYLPEGTEEKHQNHGKGKCAGYGEWGCVLDAYKREKPEAYLTKKAFTPILLDTEKSSFGEALSLHLTNRFDHAVLTEVRMVCTGEDGTVFYDDSLKEAIQPHESGVVKIAGAKGEQVRLRFYFAGDLIDEYRLEKSQPQHAPANEGEPLGINAVFDPKENIIRLAHNHVTVAEGPYFNVPTKKAVTTRLKHVRQKGDQISATVCCGLFKKYKLTVQPSGGNILFDIKSTLTSWFTAGTVVQFRLAEQSESVSWSKKSLYTAYPDTHIDRCSGTAVAKRADCGNAPDPYGVKPAWGWEADQTNYFISEAQSETNSIVTNDFKTRRNHIYHYTVKMQSGRKLRVDAASEELNAYVSCKRDKAPTLELSQGQYYPDLKWGNYFGKKSGFGQKKPIRFLLSFFAKGEEQ